MNRHFAKKVHYFFGAALFVTTAIAPLSQAQAVMVDDYEDCYSNCVDNYVAESPEQCRTQCAYQPNPSVAPPSNGGPNGTGEGGTTTNGNPGTGGYRGNGRNCYGSMNNCEPYVLPD